MSALSNRAYHAKDIQLNDDRVVHLLEDFKAIEARATKGRDLQL
jgi:hypothetical protein